MIDNSYDERKSTDYGAQGMALDMKRVIWREFRRGDITCDVKNEALRVIQEYVRGIKAVRAAIERECEERLKFARSFE